jgi:glycosyltransferase involved in cell wall biosynthesis
MSNMQWNESEIYKLYEVQDELQKELEKTLVEAGQEKLKELKLKVEIDEIKKNIEKINKKIWNTRKEINYYRNRKKMILQSRSWRYTAPLRNINRFLFAWRKDGYPASKSPVSGSKKKEVKEKKQSLSNNTVNKLSTKMLSLGLTSRAYEELSEIANDKKNLRIARSAAKELALWHANQNSKEDAVKCLEFLAALDQGKCGVNLRRQIAIMRAECYQKLGQLQDARRVIQEALERGIHADLYLAAANLEGSEKEKLKWINMVYQHYGASMVRLDELSENSIYDRLKPDGPIQTIQQTPKVTVIIPAFNAERVIGTALESVLNQTWANLEVLVVDDCSTDATVEIIKEYERKDSRVRLIQAETNGGPYVARNLALLEATGQFVTCHDADDWSHPKKIELQVIHLMENHHLIGNTTEQARATSDLVFYRRGKFGKYIFPNMSSFMFRREPVMEAIGFWDSVRFDGDTEFIHRIRKWFGEDSIVHLSTGPMSIQRQSADSLTGNSVFGYHGYYMGARKEYNEIFTDFHRRSPILKYDFPQQTRPFPIPEPMWPTREKKDGDRRHFDVIIASDFRLVGGSTLSSIEEIKAHKRFGLRTGLIQMYRYDYNPMKTINPKVRELIDGDQVQMLVYGEKVSCDVLILRYPPILQEKQKYVPDIEAGRICVIINQTPMSDYGLNGEVRYRIEQCARHLREYFGKDGIWYPIGPLVREALYQHHADELHAIHLAEEDWVNIIDVEQWRRAERPARGKKIRIGRHSRGHAVKWPADPKQLLEIYPESDKYEIHVLGGAEPPRAVLGRLPRNWHVLEFGEMEPKEFLSQLDVFVYYTHPDWVESFGRVIIEAMAVGVPVIVPPHYRILFGEAAIYAEPSEVKSKIDILMNNDQLYMEQVRKAWEYVDKNFGYLKHRDRLMNCKV